MAVSKTALPGSNPGGPATEYSTQENMSRDIFRDEEQAAIARHIFKDLKGRGAIQVGLCGSRAKGTHNPDSDVDIVAVFPKGHPDAATYFVEEVDSPPPGFDILIISERLVFDSAMAKDIRRTARWLGQKKN